MAEYPLQDELLQQVPRSVGFTRRGVLYISVAIVISVACISFMVHLFLLVDRERGEWKDLAREGRITDASEVRLGGIPEWNVHYTFISDGKAYSGIALVPKAKQGEMFSYKTSPFPVLFLPSIRQ
jgi:hypothetical protein